MTAFTCFVFASESGDEDCLCLRLNQQGEVDAALERRSYDALRLLQINAKTIVLVSAKHVSLHQLELPWLPDKKARAALPYALEEKLAEPVDDMHFAFDRTHYQNGHYLVTVCDKNWLTDLMEQLRRHDIDFDVITVDWFALKDKELLILDDGYLVRDLPQIAGFLSKELAPLYFRQAAVDRQVYRFDDSQAETLQDEQTLPGSSRLWLAKNLKTGPYLNLVQGSFQKPGAQANSKRWYWAATALTLLWLCAFLLQTGLQTRNLNRELHDSDEGIAQIYRRFFPEATQVISPKFRISQLLKSRQHAGDNVLWPLLNQLSLAIQNSKVRIEQLRYQNQSLQATMHSPDFDALESLQTNLQTAQIKVKQLQASSQEKHVVATLELSL